MEACPGPALSAIRLSKMPGNLGWCVNGSTGPRLGLAGSGVSVAPVGSLRLGGDCGHCPGEVRPVEPRRHGPRQSTLLLREPASDGQLRADRLIVLCVAEPGKWPAPAGPCGHGSPGRCRRSAACRNGKIMHALRQFGELRHRRPVDQDRNDRDVLCERGFEFDTNPVGRFENSRRPAASAASQFGPMTASRISQRSRTLRRCVRKSIPSGMASMSTKTSPFRSHAPAGRRCGR